MKMSLLLSSLVLLSTSSVFASSKVCFGSTKNDETKGKVMLAQIDVKHVSLKTIKGGEYYNGTYPTYGSVVRGRDGKTYLEYKGENSDYQDVIMVDQELLKNSTTGLLQIRARGEGFFNSVFFCKDARD